MKNDQDLSTDNNIVCHYCDYQHDCSFTDPLECKLFRQNALAFTADHSASKIDVAVIQLKTAYHFKGLISAIKRNRQSIISNRDRIDKLERELARLQQDQA